MPDATPIPLIRVQCKVCGREFVEELITPWMTKGKLECPHCHETGYYSPKDMVRVPKKAPQSVHEGNVPHFECYLFTCPNCCKETLVLSPMEHILMKRATCEHCKRDFLIENHVAKKIS